MNIKFNIKHNDFNKEIVIKDSYLIGDFVKEALQTLNIMIYSIGEIKLTYLSENNDKAAKLGVDLSFMTVFDNEVLQSLSKDDSFSVEFIDRLRDENGNVIKSDLADLYNSYIIYKQDEQMATSLQNRHDTYNNPNGLQSSIRVPNVYYIPLNPVTLEPINEEPDGGDDNVENVPPVIDGSINNIGQNITSFITNELTPLINNTDTFITSIANNPTTLETVQNNLTSLFNNTVNNTVNNPSTGLPGETVGENGVFTYSTNFLGSGLSGENTTPSSSVINLFQRIFELPITTGDQNEDVRVTVNEDKLNMLKHIEYGDITEVYCNDNNIVKSTDCTICLELFKDTETVIITKCNHLYHKTCIDKWLVDYSVKCPICRNDIIEGTPDIDEE